MDRTVNGLKDRVNLFSLPEIISVLFLLVLIQLSSFHHYLLFHSLAEFFSIAVASTIFVIAVNSWGQISNQYLRMIGISYAFIGILDMMHTLSYSGMGIFTDYDYYAPQFWVASRSLEVISMLAAFALIGREFELRLPYLVAGYSVITASIIASILYFKIFPICFVPGHGLTPFKIYSEYVIMAGFALNLYLLYQNRKYFDKSIYMLLSLFLVVMIITEYCFTLYSNLAMSGIFNDAGHLLKIIAFFLVYKAIVVTGLRDPIDLLFKDLKDNEISLINAQTLAGLVTWEWNVRMDNWKWDRSFKMVFGFDPAKLSDKASLLQMIQPNDQVLLSKSFDDAVGKGKSIKLPMTLITPSGEKFCFLEGGVINDGNPETKILEGTLQDLSLQRQLMDLQTAKNESIKLLSILRNASDGVHILDIDGNVVEASDSFCAMLGYSRDQIIGLNVSQWDAGNVEPMTLIRDQFKLTQSTLFETRHRRKDGSVFDAEITGFPFELDGKPVLFNSSRDISARKTLEVTLQEERKLNESILKLAGPIILVIDKSGAIVNFNKTAEELTGYSFEDVKGKPYFWKNFLLPEERTRTEQVFSLAMAGNLSTQIENYWIDKHGGKRLISWSNSLLTDDAGNASSLIAIGTDITQQRKAEVAMQLLGETTQNAGSGVVLVRAESGTIHYANKHFEEMFGYGSGELQGKPISLINAPSDKSPQQTADEIITTLKREGTWSGEILNRKKDGSQVWSIANVSSFQHPEFGTLLIAHQTDITERKLNEQLLKKYSQEIEDLYNHAPCGYHSIDAEGRIVRVNQTELDWLGYSREEMVGKFLMDFLTPVHGQAVLNNMDRLIKSGHLSNEEREFVRKDGTTLKVELNSTAVYDENGKFLMSRSIVTDISDRKIFESQIQQLAYYDHLTGLPNRRLFRDRLEQDIKRVARSKTSLALLFVDLDRFKEVNDTLGHDKGDLLLIEAARRIRQHVRETDTLARLGGDEFTIILSEYREISNIERVVQSVVNDLTIPFDLGTGNVGHISASVGISIYPEDARNIDDLLKNADQAMYAAKQAGRNGYRYFTRSMQNEMKSKVTLIKDLRVALEQNQFEVYFQPIVDVRTREIVKAEALLRWQHPTKGMISPAVFIPLAEESRLILTIGEWVFEEALRNIVKWKENTGKLIQVSVNKSSVQFTNMETHPWHESYLKSGLPERSITVEITESLLLSDSDNIRNQFKFFKEHGIELSIDDFGTGFSALSYLHQFDVDYIKIDKSFVQKIMIDSASRALTEAIITMANKLGIKTIAEGVENESQRDLLKSFGCDYIQGYFYSEPVPSDEFEKLIVGCCPISNV